MNEIGKKLVNLRGAKSRGEVSKALNISVSTLAMYEQGHRVPRDDIKIRIARLYGVSVESLFFSQEVHKTCSGHTA